MEQKIIRRLETIGSFLEGKNFLLVRSGAYDSLEIKKFFNSFPHVEFSSFTPNPLYEQVCEGIKVFNQEQCNMIVAVGGGSTIDVAKCIKLYCRMDESINYLKQTIVDSGIPLIAVPTTAGTGSESTRHAVIYFEGKKQSISHESIVPDYAILDPSVLKTLPVYQKKCTMLDALCQAIESWWSVNSTDESKQFSMMAIDAIKANWKEYIYENTDLAAERILNAANLAGHAINITATTAAHAMSYKITSMYNFPHGHAVAVCMPEVWEYMLQHMDACIDPRGVKYLNVTMNEISQNLSLVYYKNMLQMLEMSRPESKDKDEEVEILAESVDSVRLKNNPVELRAEVLKGMYGRIIL